MPPSSPVQVHGLASDRGYHGQHPICRTMTAPPLFLLLLLFLCIVAFEETARMGGEYVGYSNRGFLVCKYTLVQKWRQHNLAAPCQGACEADVIMRPVFTFFPFL